MLSGTLKNRKNNTQECLIRCLLNRSVPVFCPLSCKCFLLIVLKVWNVFSMIFITEFLIRLPGLKFESVWNLRNVSETKTLPVDTVTDRESHYNKWEISHEFRCACKTKEINDSNGTPSASASIQDEILTQQVPIAHAHEPLVMNKNTRNVSASEINTDDEWQLNSKDSTLYLRHNKLSEMVSLFSDLFLFLQYKLNSEKTNNNQSAKFQFDLGKRPILEFEVAISLNTVIDENLPWKGFLEEKRQQGARTSCAIQM